MNILCALALSQVKRKKTRTVITVSAISLSTSLLTAVINFAASGHAMLTRFLGKNYGEYGNAYIPLLLIPSLFLGGLVVAMSVTVISNVFRMSANERVAQFGALKCVGATKKQIYQTIMYECLLLCTVAIPLGLMLGYALSFLGIRITNHYTEELNTLMRMMIKKISLDLTFEFSPAALLLSAVISLGTAAFAAMLPARKAMVIPALDCLRNGGQLDTSNYKRTKINLQAGKNLEYQLARKNAASNRKRMRSAVNTFSLSILLFVTISGLKEIADGIQEYMAFDYGCTVVADYTSNYKDTIHPQTGRRQRHCAQKISSALAEEITGKLSEYEGTDIYGCGQDYTTYVAVYELAELTEEMQNALAGQVQDGQTRIQLEVERIILDNRHYRELCQLAGAPWGSNILLNDYTYNDRGTKRHISPFPMTLSSLEVEEADGSSTEIKVGGILTTEEIPLQLLYPNTNPIRLVVPEAEVRGYSWMASPENEEGYMEYARNLLETYFPQNGLEYGQAGYVSRVYGAQDFAKFMNISIVLTAVFLYAFVFLLGFIGILNVISAVSFQIKMRAREFAVLQSVGMTPESLQKMLNMESILCAGKALIIGFPVGILAVLLLKYSVQMLFPIPFQMPWAAMGTTILISFAVMWGTVQISSWALKKQNVIETIRI